MAVEGRYKEYKFLKRDVILPAMKEVNEHSNIQVELRTVRKGRAVTALQFIVSSNQQLALLGMEDEDEVSASDAYKALLGLGVSKTLARSWVIEYGEEHVLDKVDLTQTQAASGKIRSSKAGFLKSAIEQGYHNENAIKKKALDAAQEKKRAREIIERDLERLRTSQREAETSYRWHVAHIVEKAFEALPDAQKESVLSEFHAGLSGSIYVSAFKKGGWKDRLTFPDIKKFWEGQGLVLPSPAAWAVETGSQEPDILKAEISTTEKKLKAL